MNTRYRVRVTRRDGEPETHDRIFATWAEAHAYREPMQRDAYTYDEAWLVAIDNEGQEVQP